MNVQDSDDQVVVNVAEMKEEAKKMGREQFADVGESEESISRSGYKDGANWINNISPKLREMAGFGDPMGVRTYQENRTVVDEHGTEYSSHEIMTELVRQFDEGAYTALADNKK
jgi:hypothetical protein